ncbi:Nuclear RNA export factor 1 [Operophtera brumata]|uniref:Nuclear RNA export factor 1 n=1 Tax=Operophtera brumata TaxID=104452 RepID=A0A0L7LRY5_OPEBR|nr:Nuclear RNA export factor 1 [Operophtera brumata]
MPKRGGRARQWKDNDHFEHDDRIQSTTRRVSFKPGTNKGKNKFNKAWNDPKLLLDDDIDMGAQGGNRRGAFRGRGGRLNSPAPRGGHTQRKRFVAGLLPWYQVIIPHGSKHEKDVILKSLLSFIAPDIFIPHYYRVNGNAAIFYVDDSKMAEKLFNADRKISMSDGFKLVVIVRNAVPNVIPFLGSLDSLKQLPLVELYLKGNPCEKRFNDHEIYVSDVRKKFPKLMKLDGVDLPPAIGFDLSEDVALPPRQQSFLVDPAGQDLVREFLTQYFAIYDSESRQALLEAYHEQASLSMAASYLSSENRNVSNSNRNLLRITERESRRRYLRTGRLQVVSFLSDLPKTTHDLMGAGGFCVMNDMLFISNTTKEQVSTPVTALAMNGVFKETDGGHAHARVPPHLRDRAQLTAGTPTRAFHRTFVIVPNSAGGFCVMNDMLFISNTTKEQEEKAFSTGVATEPAPAPAPAPAAGSDEAKKMMLVMLSQQTGMNENWSINCLQETGWDYQRALFIFNQLHTTGKIPPEAFVK